MWKIEACHKIIHYDTFDSCTVSRHAHPKQLKNVIYHVHDYKTIPPSQQHSSAQNNLMKGKIKCLTPVVDYLTGNRPSVLSVPVTPRESLRSASWRQSFVVLFSSLSLFVHSNFLIKVLFRHSLNHEFGLWREMRIQAVGLP